MQATSLRLAAGRLLLAPRPGSFVGLVSFTTSEEPRQHRMLRFSQARLPAQPSPAASQRRGRRLAPRASMGASGDSKRTVSARAPAACRPPPSLDAQSRLASSNLPPVVLPRLQACACCHQGKAQPFDSCISHRHASHFKRRPRPSGATTHPTAATPPHSAAACRPQRRRWQSRPQPAQTAAA